MNEHGTGDMPLSCFSWVQRIRVIETLHTHGCRAEGDAFWSCGLSSVAGCLRGRREGGERAEWREAGEVDPFDDGGAIQNWSSLLVGRLP